MAYVKGRTGSNPIVVLGDLDFNEVKQSLKTYLMSFDEFSDYDFEGSALSTILDLLSYNTAFYSYYANMIANESFLDTATKRSSVASLVKPLSYLPRSPRSSRATIVVANNTNTSVKLSPDQHAFYGNSTSTTWTPVKQYDIDAESEREIDIQEGTYIVSSDMPTVDNAIKHQRFRITNSERIDTTSLRIFVNESTATDFGTEYFDINQIVGGAAGVSGDDPVYLLTTGYDEGYEIYFGDGVLGKNPLHGAVVTATFIATNGELGNGESSFSQASTTPVGVVSTAIAGAGGAGAESIESIKMNAPLFFQAQGRAVTARDLKSLIQQSNTGILANAWGGEDQDPPQYGKVMICAYGSEGDQVSLETRNELIELCERKSVVSILPIFVEPNLIDVVLRGDIFYDPFTTTTPSDQLIEKVNNYISGFDLNDFETPFNYSKFAVGILDLDAGFVGDDILAYIRKSFEIAEGDSISALTFTVDNPLAESGGVAGTVLRAENIMVNSEFDDNAISVYLIDNGSGVINAYRTDNNSLFKRGVGSIKYDTGRVQIDGLTMLSSFGVELRPRSNNVNCRASTLLNVINGGITLIS